MLSKTESIGNYNGILSDIVKNPLFKIFHCFRQKIDKYIIIFGQIYFFKIFFAKVYIFESLHMVYQSAIINSKSIEVISFSFGKFIIFDKISEHFTISAS